MSLRILAVDDFEPWRRFISSALRNQLDVHTFVEVSDGLEAVARADELRPDLILLDIGIPKLNGIRAAQQIRARAPNSRILFLTEECSPDVAEAALEAGGAGYVVKSDAGRELLAAVRALAEGKRYISAKLAGQVFVGTPSNDPLDEHTFHELKLSSDDTELLGHFTDFIAGSLNSGNAVLAIVTEAHQQGLFQRLQTRGFNLGAATKSGAYIPLDVYQTLDSFMVDGQLDEDRFWNVAHNLVETATKAQNGVTRRLCACGECAPSLCRQGKLDTALRVEELWDAASRKYGIRTLCGYIRDGLGGNCDQPMFRAICSMHSPVISRENGVQLR